MGQPNSSGLERRVLILAPTARDAEITRALLEKAKLTCHICPDICALSVELRRGAAAILLTEEVIATPEVADLLAALKEQPAWSDLPVVLLVRSGKEPATPANVLEQLNNVTLLERPAPLRSVSSAVQAAVRGRMRQYQIRDQLEEIRLTEERFRQLANSIPQLAWMARPDGSVFWFNERWQQYTGEAFERTQGWGWQKLVDPAELPHVIQRWEQSLQNGQPWEDTFPLRRHDGQFRWHLSRANPVRDSEKKIVMWFGTNTDVTEQREIQARLKQLVEVTQRRASEVEIGRREAERANRMKDEFLATLSHELRTPLNAIVGWIHILRQEPDDPQLVEEGINVIDRNVSAQVQLIEDLLDMSRIISGKVRLDIQLVELADIIAAAIESVRPAANAKAIRIEKNLESKTQVYGDAGRLQQVLWNLLNNAIKFTPRGGSVQISSRRMESHLEISVSDTGEGIDPAFLPRLFERFSQEDSSTKRRHGGLGLGLSIVKNLVEMHGGTIRADSAGVGKGARFTIDLPLHPHVERGDEVRSHQGKTSSEKTSALMPVAKLRGVKVLVVDDEPDARELIKRFLVQCEAVPALAASANEAEKLVQSFAPDVILSDIGMPERDGYDFIRTLRHHGNKTPAVALTAFARAEDRDRSIQAGYQAYLSKPVEPAVLLAVVAGMAGK